MSSLLFTSAGHSPGVTALTLALGLAWPGPVLVADCNREPDQSVLAGYLQGLDPSGRGLGGVLQAYRERRPVSDCLPGLTAGLDGDGRDFLPGFSHPGMVALFAPVWAELASAFERLEATVLVDLAALRLYLPLVLAEAGPDRVGLVVVGPGRPYGASEISHRFEVPVWGKVAWSPVAAAVYAAGEPAPRRLVNPYAADVAALASVLAERTVKRNVLLGVPR